MAGAKCEETKALSREQNGESALLYQRVYHFRQIEHTEAILDSYLPLENARGGGGGELGWMVRHLSAPRSRAIKGRNWKVEIRFALVFGEV